MPEAILVLNAGSSSIKFSVYALSPADRLSLDAKGQVEGIGTRPHFLAEDADGVSLRDEVFEIAGSVRGVAWHRDRPCGQPRRRAAHLDRGQQGRGVCHPDRRGADDRPADACRPAPGANRWSCLMAPTETVRPLAFDAGFTVAGLATDAARLITGDTVHINGGYHIMG